MSEKRLLRCLNFVTRSENKFVTPTKVFSLMRLFETCVNHQARDQKDQLNKRV